MDKLSQQVLLGAAGAGGVTPKGEEWTFVLPVGTASTINALTYGNNLYVYGGTGGVLATSTDAITWTARTSGTASAIRSVIYGDDLYVYAGDGGVLATSTNAITWTARTSGTASAILALTYGNNLYVYGGLDGVLATSTDAITWTARTSNTVSTINALTYGDKYVYGGIIGIAATSTDAVTWVPPNVAGPTLTYAYNPDTGLIVSSSNAGVIKTSTDGFNWTVRTSGTVSTIRVAYGNNIYVYGGTDGVLATSTDAIT